jgi:hypothetical protein
MYIEISKNIIIITTYYILYVEKTRMNIVYVYIFINLNNLAVNLN